MIFSNIVSWIIIQLPLCHGSENPWLDLLSVLSRPKDSVSDTTMIERKDDHPVEIQSAIEVLTEIAISQKESLNQEYTEYKSDMDDEMELIEEGRKQGREEGRKQGREEGRKQGREEGRKQGREAGIEEGIRIGKLESELDTILVYYQEKIGIVIKAKLCGMTIESISTLSDFSEECVSAILLIADLFNYYLENDSDDFSLVLEQYCENFEVSLDTVNRLICVCYDYYNSQDVITSR